MAEQKATMVDPVSAEMAASLRGDKIMSVWKTMAALAALIAAVALSSAGAFAAGMQCPQARGSYQAAGTGTQYATDSAGVVAYVALQDVGSMTSAGCHILGTSSGLIGILHADMNSTYDQQIPLFVTNNVYRITKITAANASVDLTTAAGGIYPAPAKAGTAPVANSQVYSALTTNQLAVDLTLATATTVYPVGQKLYFSLTTAQGAAATADIMVYGDVGF
jgi:hypothetical protein